ncbi:hypothetical protein D3C73_892430 [compost metagenome]
MLDVFLFHRKRQTGGNANLLADNVDAGDFFGDGVFHLHPGVHLHEVHLALGEQELHGAGVLVAHGLGCTHRQVADVGALFRGQLRARGDLDQLLVAALDRAVTLEQVHHIAEAVAKDLRFDMLGIDDAFFQEHFRRTECLGGFGNDPRESLFKFFTAVAATNTATTTTGCGLEHHRVADAIAFGQGFFDARHVAFGAWSDRHAGLDHAAARFGLVAHAANDFSRWTDEFDPALSADFRQFGVFRKEAITGVQRIAAGFHSQVHQLARVQVSGQRFGTDAMGLVRTLHMQGMAVSVGIDRDRANAHFGTGTYDSYGNLTTVGDQDLCYHLEFPLSRWYPRPARPRSTRDQMFQFGRRSTLAPTRD